MFCEDVLLAQTITGWSTVSLVVVKSDWGAQKKLRHLVVMILATMVEWLQINIILIRSETKFRSKKPCLQSATQRG